MLSLSTTSEIPDAIPNTNINITIVIDINNPIAPVISPEIAIPLLFDLIPAIPNIIAKTPHGIDIFHKQKNTIDIIPNTNDAIHNPFLLFSSVFFTASFVLLFVFTFSS